MDELKKIESIFLQNQLNDLIIEKLKKIKQLQNNFKLDPLEYTKKENIMFSVNTTYLLLFKR